MRALHNPKSPHALSTDSRPLQPARFGQARLRMNNDLPMPALGYLTARIALSKRQQTSLPRLPGFQIEEAILFSRSDLLNDRRTAFQWVITAWPANPEAESACARIYLNAVSTEKLSMKPWARWMMIVNSPLPSGFWHPGPFPSGPGTNCTGFCVTEVLVLQLLSGSTCIMKT